VEKKLINRKKKNAPGVRNVFVKGLESRDASTHQVLASSSS
jgi:hypothetical protein